MPYADPEKRKEYERKRAKDPKRMENCRMRYRRDIEKRRAYESKRSGTEHRRSYAKELRLRKLEHFRLKDKEDYLRNKVQHIERVMRRYKHKGMATPKWLTQEQKHELCRIYKERPPGYHVDHIIPIQGKNVCGLHVPWNLQYLPAAENIRKGNKV